MKKVLVLASVASMIDQFNMQNINILKELNCEVHVAANFQYGSTMTIEKVESLKEKLKSANIIIHDIEFERNAFSYKNLNAYKKVKDLITNEEFDLIHCHSPIGGVITRLAARKAREKGTKVIYTAHGFHFYKGSPLMNWVIYYPLEKVLSRFTDTIITINKEDYELKDKLKANNIVYIPGIGVDTKKIKKINSDKYFLRNELGIPIDAVMLVSIGELNKNKNHINIIKSLTKIENSNIYYVICGQGELNSSLNELAESLDVKEKVKILGFRNDVIAILKVADIFCFPSFREGLPVSLMEAMASNLPCIVTNIRGNIDLIVENKGGFFIDPIEIDDTVEALKELIDNPSLRKEMGLFNYEFVEKFSQENVTHLMKKVYEECF